MTWIEQPVEVDHEVAHVGVVHGLLRLRFPRRMGAGVIRVDADDVDLVEVLERDVFKVGQFTADDEVKQLLRGAIWHDGLS